MNFNVDSDDDKTDTSTNVTDASTSDTKTRSNLHNDSDTVYRRGQKRPKKKRQKDKNEQKPKEEWKADPNFDADKLKLTSELKEQQNDRSRAGGLDPQIADFVETINKKQDYYTTSSCAGRIIVVLQKSTKNETTGKEKLNVEWIYLTHEDNLSYTELHAALMKRINELNNPNGNVNTDNNNNTNTSQNQSIEQQSVEAKKNPLGERIEDEETEIWFKMEPPIVAIRTRDIQSAALLLNHARANHLKNCAIRSLGNDGKVMVTLVDTHRVETLLAINGKMLVDEKYVQTLVEISNLKLVASRKRFDELTLCLDQRLK